MIFLEDKAIKVGGVVLPGVVKSIEITGSATIEEQEVEGTSQKPKQATGYDNAKITIELVIATDSKGVTKERKIETIQKLFRTSGQAKSKVFNIVNEYTAARNINKVYFKGFSTKHILSTTLVIASLDFWEYEPLIITSQKKSTTSNTVSSNTVSNNAAARTYLSEAYLNYLDNDRGISPNKAPYKVTSTAARDTARVDVIKKEMKETLTNAFTPKIHGGGGRSF